MKKLLMTFLVLIVSVVLIGCGKKDKGDIIKSLGEQVEDLTKFEVDAVMELSDNNKKHTFDINVKYFKTKDNLELFKVTLQNHDSNSVQVILKNEEGVFVLNPTLNKSFKFQSDWPLNSSQPYLYQSLVKDILNDKNVLFVKQSEDFVFETKVDYLKSKDLVKQKVIINGKTLFPKEVTVFDGNDAERIKVMFGDVNYKPEFKEGEFYVEPTMSTVKEVFGNEIPVIQEDRPTFYPTFLMDSVELVEEKPFDNDFRIIMTYAGADNEFTMIQEYANYSDEMAIEIISGDIVILGDGIAFVTGNSLTWYRDGLTITIIAEEIDQNIISVANSLIGTEK